MIKTYLFFLLATSVSAHRDSAYFHNANDGFNTRTRWMSGIPNSRRLSELAIPGTHDSGANGKNSDSVFTQCLNFDEQLRYGIRFFDIRVRHFRNSFPIHHGAVYLNKNVNNFLTSIHNFLKENPTETVLFRLKEEHKAEENSRSIQDTLQEYLNGYDTYLKTTDKSITLGEARGKFIIFSNNGNFNSFGIDYGSLHIQDYFNLGSNWDLYGKWEKVKDYIDLAKNGDFATFYINYLSGSGGSFPYFVASGHMSPGTSASRLSTGRTTPAFKNSWVDFPRVNCFIGICTIAFEGTNILARNRIKDLNNNRQTRTVGIIVADFPGDDLIYEIVRQNWMLN